MQRKYFFLQALHVVPVTDCVLIVVYEKVFGDGKSEYRVLILGSSGTGKTALIKRYSPFLTLCDTVTLWHRKNCPR